MLKINNNSYKNGNFNKSNLTSSEKSSNANNKKLSTANKIVNRQNFGVKNLNVPKINICDSEDNIIYTSEMNAKLINTKSKTLEYDDDDDDILEVEPEARVNRFLSIYEVDDNIMINDFNKLNPLAEDEEEEFSTVKTEQLPQLQQNNSEIAKKKRSDATMKKILNC